MANSDTILTQAYGYGYILGLGALFALLMCSVTFVLSRYLGQAQNSESFSTASRSVGTGLVSSAVVSSWIWPATLLTSGLWGYTYGISGGFMYGVHGGLTITIFTQLAIEIKKVAPGCHTVAEIIKARYNKQSHWVYLFYVIATNIMVSSCLLLGASQGFNAATGINIVAANFLFPVGVCVYTTFGGLKATFISDWIHTVIIYIVVIIICFKLISSDIFGGIDGFYEMLLEADAKFPSSGTSYLSFHNKEMFETVYAVFVGSLSGVLGDPSYAQKAIAAESVLTGYFLGGIAWATIPMILGLAGGMGCRALLVYPGFRTYPNALSSTESSAGLPVIYTFGALLGNGGAAAAVLNLFMSATSAMSAELIAFSSIVTYDIYRGYIKPDATGKQLVNMSHIATIVFSLFISCVSVIFNYIGVTVSWLITFYGILLAPGVAILTLTLFWKKTSNFGVSIGGPLGTLVGLGCWIGSSYNESGYVDKTSLMGSQALLIGNYSSVTSSFVFIMLLSYIKRDPDFDFSTLGDAFQAGDDANEEEIKLMHANAQNKKKLQLQSKLCLALNTFALCIGFVVVPLSLYGSNYIFSKVYFRQWYIIMMILVLASALYITIFPLWQGRKALLQIFKGISTGKIVKHKSSSDVELVEGISEDTNSSVEKIEVHDYNEKLSKDI